MADALNYTASGTVQSLHNLPHYDLKLQRIDSTFATNDQQYLVSGNDGLSFCSQQDKESQL